MAADKKTEKRRADRIAERASRIEAFKGLGNCIGCWAIVILGILLVCLILYLHDPEIPRPTHNLGGGAGHIR